MVNPSVTHLNDKVTIIIRSVGERTESLCRDLILAQGLAPANITIVRESPFSAAMRESFKIGLERDLRWTLCVDADVLLRPGSIHQLVQMAEMQEDNVCEVQGFILDKFFGGPREAGNHLYRTALLNEVTRQIPMEGVDIRPEYYTLKTMKDKGYPWVTVPYVVGLHDFEQYYHDIFRKCFVHAHKHDHRLYLFARYWRRMSSTDKDYAVALTGLATGLVTTEHIRIDAENFLKEFPDMATKYGWIEKESPMRNALDLSYVEGVIQGWVDAEEYLKAYPTYAGLYPRTHTQTRTEFLLQQRHKIGVIRLFLWSMGWFLGRVGGKLKNWAIKPGEG